VYTRLRRQTATFLIEDAIKDGLAEPLAASAHERIAEPLVLFTASRCDAALRDQLRGRLAGATAGRDHEVEYALSLEQGELGAVRNLGLLTTAGSRVLWIGTRDPFAASSCGPTGEGTEWSALFASFENILGVALAELPEHASPAAKLSPEAADWWLRCRADSWVAAVQAECVPREDADGGREHRVIRTGKPAFVRHPASIAFTVQGIDNRRMMPPCLPHVRGRDRVWGWLISLTYPSAVALELPFSIRDDVAECPGPDAVGVEDLVVQLLRSHSLPTAIADPETRLTLTGKFLVSCGRMSAAALRDVVVSDALRKFALRSRGRAAAHAAGDDVRADASDLMPDRMPEGDVSAARETLVRFGHLLVAWPGIWRAALACAEVRA